MHGKKIVNNSVIGIAYRITLLILGFVTRKIFIVFLGEELLGLNSLYANLLDLLNLADLGMGVAVQYQLYEPLTQKDYGKISKIITAAKKIYNLIGFAILFAGFALSFFIQFLIKGTVYPIWYVRVSFLISVSGVALGYFFVHKRLFLQANEELGLVNIIDLVAKLITIAVSLITTIVFRNYFLYLIINALCGTVSNLIIHYIFKKRYPQIHANERQVSREVKELTANLKNVIPMKLSNYVYNSTDNMIISKLLGLSTVALYSNYMTIINGIMNIEYLIGNVITASIGKMIKEIKDTERIFSYYLIFQYVQYAFTNFCMVSLALLCSPFIKWWIGDRFLVDRFTFVVLIVDFYIHSMYQPAYVMFGAAGKFKDDKYITLASAAMNLTISIILVNLIGLPGVIMGTLITDIYIWAVRTYQMVKHYFQQSLLRYGIKMLKYILGTLMSLGLAGRVSHFLVVDHVFLELMIKILICVIIPNTVTLVFTWNSEEFKSCREYMIKTIKRKEIK